MTESDAMRCFDRKPRIPHPVTPHDVGGTR